MTATASGAQVPDFPQVNPVQTPEAHTTDDTLVLADMFKIHTNAGISANLPLTLPAASACPGCIFRVHALAAQTVTFEPAASTEKIYLHGSGVANTHLVLAGVIGNYVDLYSDGANWIVARHSGVLTKES